VLNILADGRRIKLADAGAGEIEWRLRLEGLSDQERQALESFHTAVEGSLRTFAFLDPTDNLLAWSEDFSQPAWNKGALLELSGGISDPMGGTSAFRAENAGAAPQQVEQELHVPGGYFVSFSIWVRGDDPGGKMALLLGTERTEQPVGSEWRRVSTAGVAKDATDSVRFGLEIGAGVSVDLFGAQAEGQLGVSTYRPKYGRTGVYEAARLADDELEITTHGPGLHACVMRVIHAGD
jgi:hypothetical protein